MKPSDHNTTLAALGTALLLAAKPLHESTDEDTALIRRFLNERGSALREIVLHANRSDWLLRLSARRHAAAFAIICDVYAAIGTDAEISADLRDRLAAVATGCELPAPSADGPVTPTELLTIAHRLAGIGETADAARLRRLADYLMAQATMTPYYTINVDAGSDRDSSAMAISERGKDGVYSFRIIEIEFEAFAGDRRGIMLLRVPTDNGGFVHTTVHGMVSGAVPDDNWCNRHELATRIHQHLIEISKGGAR